MYAASFWATDKADVILAPAIVNFLSMLGLGCSLSEVCLEGGGEQHTRARALPGVAANLLAGRLPLKKATATIAG